MKTLLIRYESADIPEHYSLDGVVVMDFLPKKSLDPIHRALRHFWQFVVIARKEHEERARAYLGQVQGILNRATGQCGHAYWRNRTKWEVLLDLVD